MRAVSLTVCVLRLRQPVQYHDSSHAIDYTLKRWTALNQSITHGTLEIDSKGPAGCGSWDRHSRCQFLKAGNTAPARATYGEMVGNYRESVLTAFSELEYHLAAQRLLASQYGAQSDALLAARKQLEIADNRYRDDLTTYLDVVTEESTALNIEFSATQLRGQQLVAAVTLVKSLGGGWHEAKEL